MLEIKKSEFRENVESFAIAVLTILFIMIFVVRSYKVQGQSMEPTIHEGEMLMVNRYIFNFRPPKTGDIVVIIPPGDPKRKYIKRVIGGPRQTVRVENSKLYVDGMEIKEPYIRETMQTGDFTQQVPDGSIFVMGDNRNNSTDSRNASVVGFVPLKNVVGKAIFVFWPITDVQILQNPDYSYTPSIPTQFSRYPQGQP
jgi:signal peptidase I